MKNILLPVLALLFFVSVVSAQDKAVKGEKAPLAKKAKTEKVSGSESTAVVNTVCPVSGEELEDNENTIKYEGKTYAVCCKKCLAKIEKDPEKYISRLSEDGKSLKKK